MQLQPDYQMHTIKVDTVPLADRIASISRQLSMGSARSFYDLLDKSQGKVGVVVSFVAVLELMKRQLIGVVSNDTDDNSSMNVVNSHQADTDARFENLTFQWLV